MNLNELKKNSKLTSNKKLFFIVSITIQRAEHDFGGPLRTKKKTLFRSKFAFLHNNLINLCPEQLLP